MFNESSPGRWVVLQLPCCPSKGNFQKTYYKTFGTSNLKLPPQTVFDCLAMTGHGSEGREGEPARRPHQVAGVVLGRQGVCGQVRRPRHQGAGTVPASAQPPRNAGKSPRNWAMVSLCCVQRKSGAFWAKIKILPICDPHFIHNLPTNNPPHSFSAFSPNIPH